MGKTKKIGSAGRFGSRYGKRIRSLVSEIEKEQRKRQACPRCGMDYVKRVSSGVWQCRKCGLKFAGLAYHPHAESKKV